VFPPMALPPDAPRRADPEEAGRRFTHRRRDSLPDRKLHARRHRRLPDGGLADGGLLSLRRGAGPERTLRQESGQALHRRCGRQDVAGDCSGGSRRGRAGQSFAGLSKKWAAG
jgi:hypothetical protein